MVLARASFAIPVHNTVADNGLQIDMATQPTQRVRNSESFVKTLAIELGEDWAAIDTAREQAQQHIEELRSSVLSLKPPSNTSVIGFGSLAREEWTSGSDIDWTLMIDGPADMDHFDFAKGVQ